MPRYFSSRDTKTGYIPRSIATEVSGWLGQLQQKQKALDLYRNMLTQYGSIEPIAHNKLVLDQSMVAGAGNLVNQKLSEVAKYLRRGDTDSAAAGLRQIQNLLGLSSPMTANPTEPMQVTEQTVQTMDGTGGRGRKKSSSTQTSYTTTTASGQTVSGQRRQPYTATTSDIYGVDAGTYGTITMNLYGRPVNINVRNPLAVIAMTNTYLSNMRRRFNEAGLGELGAGLEDAYSAMINGAQITADDFNARMTVLNDLNSFDVDTKYQQEYLKAVDVLRDSMVVSGEQTKSRTTGYGASTAYVTKKKTSPTIAKAAIGKFVSNSAARTVMRAHMYNDIFVGDNNSTKLAYQISGANKILEKYGLFLPSSNAMQVGEGKMTNGNAMQMSMILWDAAGRFVQETGLSYNAFSNMCNSASTTAPQSINNNSGEAAAMKKYCQTIEEGENKGRKYYEVLFESFLLQAMSKYDVDGSIYGLRECLSQAQDDKAKQACYQQYQNMQYTGGLYSACEDKEGADRWQCINAIKVRALRNKLGQFQEAYFYGDAFDQAKDIIAGAIKEDVNIKTVTLRAPSSGSGKTNDVIMNNPETINTQNAPSTGDLKVITPEVVKAVKEGNFNDLRFKTYRGLIVKTVSDAVALKAAHPKKTIQDKVQVDHNRVVVYMPVLSSGTHESIGSSAWYGLAKKALDVGEDEFVDMMFNYLTSKGYVQIGKEREELFKNAVLRNMYHELVTGSETKKPSGYRTVAGQTAGDFIDIETDIAEQLFGTEYKSSLEQIARGAISFFADDYFNNPDYYKGWVSPKINERIGTVVEKRITKSAKDYGRQVGIETYNSTGKFQTNIKSTTNSVGTAINTANNSLILVDKVVEGKNVYLKPGSVRVKSIARYTDRGEPVFVVEGDLVDKEGNYIDKKSRRGTVTVSYTALANAGVSIDSSFNTYNNYVKSWYEGGKPIDGDFQTVKTSASLIGALALAKGSKQAGLFYGSDVAIGGYNSQLNLRGTYGPSSEIIKQNGEPVTLYVDVSNNSLGIVPIEVQYSNGKYIMRIPQNNLVSKEVVKKDADKVAELGGQVQAGEGIDGVLIEVPTWKDFLEVVGLLTVSNWLTVTKPGQNYDTQ